MISLPRGRDEYIDLRAALTELSAFFGFVTPWTAMQAYARGGAYNYRAVFCLDSSDLYFDTCFVQILEPVSALA